MVADAVIQAGLAPDSYTKGERGVALNAKQIKSRIMIGIMKGAEVGFPPITALSTIAIINNRPTIWGDGAVALCQRDGEVEKQETSWDGKGDTLECTVKLWRRGQDEPYIGEFSMTDAKRAKLLNNPKKPTWTLYPERMLFNRARAYAIRDGFSDKLCGLHIREEIEDIPVAPAEVDSSFLDDDGGKVIEHEADTTSEKAEDEIGGEDTQRGSDALVAAPTVEEIVTAIATHKTVDDLDTYITDELIEAAFAAMDEAEQERVNQAYHDHKENLESTA